MVQMFAFVIFLLVAWKIWNEFTSDQVNSDLWDKTSVGSSIKANTQRAFENWDWVGVLAYFGMHLGIIVLVFLLRSHPIVYVGGIFVIVIMVIVAVPLSNAWQDEISVDPDFANEITKLPRLDYIMDMLPIFEMIWGFVSLICFAAFARGEAII